jgi:hypothetical protein
VLAFERLDDYPRHVGELPERFTYRRIDGDPVGHTCGVELVDWRRPGGLALAFRDRNRRFGLEVR